MLSVLNDQKALIKIGAVKVSEKEIKKKSIYSPANLCTTCTYTYVCQYSADERMILEYDETKEQKNWKYL